MHKQLLIAAMLLSNGTISTTAKADQMTVGDLNTICAGTSVEPVAACKFYILGAFQGLSAAGATESQNGQFVQKSGKQFCVPDDLPDIAMRDKIVALVTADLRAFPEDTNEPAISFIMAAITKMYPCVYIRK